MSKYLRSCQSQPGLKNIISPCVAMISMGYRKSFCCQSWLKLKQNYFLTHSYLFSHFLSYFRVLPSTYLLLLLPVCSKPKCWMYDVVAHSWQKNWAKWKMWKLYLCNLNEKPTSTKRSTLVRKRKKNCRNFYILFFASCPIKLKTGILARKYYLNKFHFEINYFSAKIIHNEFSVLVPFVKSAAAAVLGQ